MIKKRPHGRGYSNLHSQRQSLVHTEYGLARVIEPSKVIIHQNQYLLKEIQHSYRKMRSMEKEIKKIKHRIHKCEQSAHQHPHEDLLKEIQFIKRSKLESISGQTLSSPIETFSSRHKRQVGRFTRILGSQNQEQYLIRGKKSRKSPTAPPQLYRSSHSKKSALEYSQDDYIQEFIKPEKSNKSSLLLSKNFDEEDRKIDQNKLIHQYEELVLEEKNTPVSFEKKRLKQQISQMSAKLAALSENLT